MPTLLQPKKSDVILHPMSLPDRSNSGLIVKSEAHKDKMRYRQGVIVAIGEEAEEHLDGYGVGDAVIFNPYAGSHVAIEDGAYLVVLYHEQVLAKLVDSPVKIIDTETAKVIVQERIEEVRKRIALNDVTDLQKAISMVEEGILDRIESFVVSEAFEWSF